MMSATNNKTHTAIIKKDGLEYSPSVFVYLQGPCKLCSTTNNSLIVLTYKPNNEEKGEGIFDTYCMSCKGRHVYFYKNIAVQQEE